VGLHPQRQHLDPARIEAGWHRRCRKPRVPRRFGRGVRRRHDRHRRFADNSDIGAAWIFAAPNFNPTATHDFNGDGYSDILWRGPSGDVAIWFMNGTQVVSSSDFINVPTSWTIQGANAD
jgi:hypothetical protein